MEPKQPSKKIQVWVSPEAHQKLLARAKQETRTLASYVRHYLYKHLGLEE